MQIRPQQMQLGFLKVLKGSYMEQAAPSYGLEYSRRPPFQVIRTRWISFDDLLLLRDMETRRRTTTTVPFSLPRLAGCSTRRSPPSPSLWIWANS